MTLRLGIDPRSATDTFLLLKQLASNIFDLPDNISFETGDILEQIFHVSKAGLVGPRFRCPSCRQVLLNTPIRLYLMEALLDTLPEEVHEEIEIPKSEGRLNGGSDVQERGDDNGEGSSKNNGNRNGKDRKENGKGKGKELEKETFAWSDFFGDGMGNDASGY